MPREVGFECKGRSLASREVGQDIDRLIYFPASTAPCENLNTTLNSLQEKLEILEFIYVTF